MQIADLPGAVVASAGTLEGFRSHAAQGRARTLEERRRRNATYDAQNVRHPFTGLHIIDKGLDYLEQYIAEAAFKSLAGFGFRSRSCASSLRRARSHSWGAMLVVARKALAERLREKPRFNPLRRGSWHDCSGAARTTPTCWRPRPGRGFG